MTLGAKNDTSRGQKITSGKKMTRLGAKNDTLGQEMTLRAKKGQRGFH